MVEYASIDSPIKDPVGLVERVDVVGSVRGQLVVHLAHGGELRFAPVGCLLEGIEADDLA